MCSNFFIGFGFLLLCNGIIASPRIDPLVETKVGLIRGLTASDGDYSMFLGIPFGVVDETNPFGPSTPYPKFENTFEAYDDSAICPQIEEFNNTLVGSLDCLHLNIYVPKSATSQNRVPVLVWIYGGGFSIGFSGRYLYGPKFLVKNDIILVTINYRLGPYGFMCLGTPEVPGNQGLKDQLLALRWINNNIESFGGDVNKITIMGESAGGISVDLHLYSAQETLFKSVILQSGTAFLPGTLTEPKPELSLKLSENLGFTTDDVSEALTFLSSIDPHLIIASASTVDRFWPCIENQFDNTETFITDYPVNMEIPKVRNMPILIGFNDNEMITHYANRDTEFFEMHNGIFAERLNSGFNFDADTLLEMEMFVRHFYIGDEKITEELKFVLADMLSDFGYNYPTVRSIANYIKNRASNIYHYVFSYNGGRNFVKRKNNVTIGGAAHADEIGYLFDVSFWHEKPELHDQLILDRMTTMWANFVKYSNPTPQITELLPVRWEPINEGSPYYYLDINSELKLERRPFHNRMAFWELFYNLNKKYVTGYREY
ncbi:juvenile hormone esterase-like [Hyposmocoma kahamanoa]|uniref:juvenile hormone esterase-like n=1 Tax=Hyposmocoma kahamanoa TaxID=1477025 RepID=UPI000E6D5F76|nr:juvenile hormone esterase-like [Hyposmocoma kahamanoa]